MERLEGVLGEQYSYLERRNAPIDVQLSKKLQEFRSQGLLHPFVLSQSVNGETITWTAEQHKEMVAELAANGYQWSEEDMDKFNERFKDQH
jgi:hypothetical protein